jgi:integrase
MARSIEGPWYRASKDGWYVTHEGQSVNLRVKGRDKRADALKAWHRLLTDGTVAGADSEVVQVQKAKPETVAELVAAFLDAKRDTVKPSTHYVYACLLAHVTDAFGAKFAAELCPVAFADWMRTRTLSASSKAGLFGAVATMFRWATAEGVMPANPLANVKRPTKASRGAKAVVPDDVHERLMAVASPELRPLLVLLRETGGRPSELARLTATDVNADANVAILTRHKTDHTGKPRLIFLTPTALALLLPLMGERPTGPLLRNRRGNPWDKDAIGHALRRTCKRAGVKAIAYGYRHTFATDALAAGVPDATVAALLGHCDTSMIHRHYSHLSSRTRTLQEALGKVRG